MLKFQIKEQAGTWALWWCDRVIHKSRLERQILWQSTHACSFLYLKWQEGTILYYLHQGGYVAATVVFVNKISQKVMNGFQWHFQKMLIMGQGTADNILVMVRILGRLWSLTIPRSQLKGLWSWSNPLCYVTLYYHCLYIYLPSYKSVAICGEMSCLVCALRGLF